VEFLVRQEKTGVETELKGCQETELEMVLSEDKVRRLKSHQTVDSSDDRLSYVSVTTRNVLFDESFLNNLTKSSKEKSGSGFVLKRNKRTFLPA
jgi:hypothetical protein